MSDNFYRIYGLTLVSTEPLVGLPEVSLSLKPDVSVFHQQTPPGLPLNSPRWRHNPDFTYRDSAPLDVRQQPLLWSDDGAYVQWRYQRHMALMFSRDGAIVYARWSPGVPLAIRAFNIYGPGMGMIFKLRAEAVLHASVVAIGGTAVAFAGVSGVGKSTLAATFEKLGYPVLSDDLCVLHVSESGEFYIPPGPPRVRLLPDAAAALYGTAASQLPATADGTKLEQTLHWVDGKSLPLPLPLGAVYVIVGRGERAAIEQMRGAQSLLMLLNSLYLSHIGGIETQARDFSAVSRLTASVPTYQLTSPQGHESLQKLCRTIAARHS